MSSSKSSVPLLLFNSIAFVHNKIWPTSVLVPLNALRLV